MGEPNFLPGVRFIASGIDAALQGEAQVMPRWPGFLLAATKFLNLLQQYSASLTQALRDAGLSADSSSLSFNLRGGSQFSQQAAGNALHGGSADNGIDTAPAVELPAASRLARHTGSLDIHV